MAAFSTFQPIPLMKAPWYEPVMSNSLPPIQPPSAMPSTVEETVRPTRLAASRRGKGFAKMMGWGGAVADPARRLARREVFAHDDGVGGHDAALEQAEQRRDDVERDDRIGHQVEEQ